jgi:integrase
MIASRLSPSTINGHLDRFSLMLRYARSEQLAIAPDIQLDLLRVPETKRARDKRDAFSPSELTQVFAHPIWTGCTNPKRRHQTGKLILKDGLYWIPLMAAYSGARREEVAALMPEDFEIVDGVACYHLRDNTFRSVKTFSSERTVPIHDHLVELGLLDHVARMRKRKERAIFPELVPTNDSSSFGDRIFYNWSKVLKIQLDGNPAKLCFHSFRHFVITTLKGEKDISAKERRDLVGHVGSDAHDEVYDKATPMLDMKKVVDRLPRLFRAQKGCPCGREGVDDMSRDDPGQAERHGQLTSG